MCDPWSRKLGRELRAPRLQTGVNPPEEQPLWDLGFLPNADMTVTQCCLPPPSTFKVAPSPAKPKRTDRMGVQGKLG